MSRRVHARTLSEQGVGSLLFAVAAFTATLATPTSSEACSMPAPPVELIGYPAEGATQVPTDVRPVYDTIRANLRQPGALASSTFELRSAGDAIPVSAAL